MGKARLAAARRQAPRAPLGGRGGAAKANPNPFEVKVNRQKFQILGRKTRHDVGLPGVARARAIRKVRGCRSWLGRRLLAAAFPRLQGGGRAGRFGALLWRGQVPCTCAVLATPLTARAELSPQKPPGVLHSTA